jgi:hypothetical protein
LKQTTDKYGAIDFGIDNNMPGDERAAFKQESVLARRNLNHRMSTEVGALYHNVHGSLRR